MKTYLRKIVAFINDEEGASAIEYGLLVGLIALAIVAGATVLGTAIDRCLPGRSLVGCEHHKRAPDLREPGPEPQGFGPSLTRATSLAEGIGACSPSARRQPWGRNLWGHGVPGPRPRFIIELNTSRTEKLMRRLNPASLCME